MFFSILKKAVSNIQAMADFILNPNKPVLIPLKISQKKSEHRQIVFKCNRRG